MRILFVFGTRPEAIKLAPLVRELRSRPGCFETHVAITAQHREMLDQVLRVFAIEPDTDLNLMLPEQSLGQLTARVVAALDDTLDKVRPDFVVVQGDTTTTLCGALSAFYHRIPVGHVEAGLRTGDLRNPFPEEMNRLVAGRLATLHFAATRGAADNLLGEGIDPSTVHVTGNTGIDAVLYTRDQIVAGRWRGTLLPETDPRKKLIAVTAHRRESFGAGFDRICEALRQLASRDDVEIVYPVHPNPNVRRKVLPLLESIRGIRLTDPLPYVDFVELMMRSHLLLTDSGGIQEEGPSLGKPVIVMRSTTERPEAVQAGTVILAGTDVARIVAEVSRLLDDPEIHQAMARVHNPYGDGRASARIADLIHSFFDK